MDIKKYKEIALANIINPNNEYYYRFVCRWFSKTFHTPLNQVYNMPIEEIFITYFEETYEKINNTENGESEIFTEMMMAIDPEFDSKEEESIQEFIEMIEKEESEKKRNKQSQKPKKAANSPTLNPPQPVVRTYQDDTPPDNGESDNL